MSVKSNILTWILIVIATCLICYKQKENTQLIVKIIPIQIQEIQDMWRLDERLRRAYDYLAETGQIRPVSGLESKRLKAVDINRIKAERTITVKDTQHQIRRVR